MIKTLHLLITSFFYLIIFGFSALHAQTEIGLSTNFQYFDYEEFDTNGESLNRETGIVPGIQLLLSFHQEKLTHTVTGSIHASDVDYNGRLQNGTPHKTETGTVLYRASYRLEYPLSNEAMFIHSQINWDYWSRSIKPTTFVAGLDETYSWPSIDLGIRYSIAKSKQHELLIGASFSKIFEGNFEVDLSPIGYGDQKLDLGSGLGFRSTLSYRYKFNHSTLGKIDLFYKTWTFSESDPKTISNGSDAATIIEPRSKSKRTGVAFMLSFLF